MAKSSKDRVHHATWEPRENEAPTDVLPGRQNRPGKPGNSKATVNERDESGSLTGRAKGSRYWLKSHGDDWIERAMMGDIMDRRAMLIYENNAASRSNPYRTVNLARRLKIHNSGLCAWQQCKQFPKSFAAWRRLCRALNLTFEIRIWDEMGQIVFQSPDEPY